MKYKNNSSFLSFEETRQYARNLGLKTAREWRKNKHPLFVYKTPCKAFKNKGWTNWYDFLGTNKNYLSFEETRNYARKLNINSSRRWKALPHPKNIYKKPEVFFKNKGWTNWFDFLGKKMIRYLSFKETKEYARNLNLKSRKEWIEWFEKSQPKNIYKHPNISFINKGWVDWIDFLGISKVNFLSFEKTKNYAKKLGIKTCTEWAKIKHPTNIYKCPNMSFKNKGWTYWRDFLGTNDKYLSYEEVIKYARGLNFQSSYQWNLQKHPKNICKHPHMFFKNKGWTNWNDFLGKEGEKKMINYLSFEETKKYARNLNINSSHKWRKIKHPENILKRPDISFKNKGWTNWDDFLGI